MRWPANGVINSPFRLWVDVYTLSVNTLFRIAEITIMVVKFVDDCGHSDLLPADSMILHRDAAIDAAYEMADLWQRQARMLEQEA